MRFSNIARATHQRLISTLKYIIVSCIIATFKLIRPILGSYGTCIYYDEITCLAYAQQTLEQRSLLVAIILITKRLLSCNPINGCIRAYYRSRT